MRLFNGFILLLPLVALACAPSGSAPDLYSNDPGQKIPAIKQAAAKGDRSAAPELVRALASDDPAIRFYAIEALEKMTGDRLGYRWYEDEPARQEALARWEGWLKQQHAAAPLTRGN